MEKNGNTSVIVPTAEVKLGKYTAKFTEENLQDLYDLIKFVKEDLLDSIREYDDFIIAAYREDNSRAEECMKSLDGLRGFVWWFEQVKGIEIILENVRKD